MKKGILENISNNILERLTDKKRIDEELVNGWLDEIAGKMASSEETKKERSFKQLKDWICETWQYGGIDEVSCEQAFLLGGLWAGTKILEAQGAPARNRDLMESLVRKYTKHVWFFQTIQDQPGIIHKELAAKGGQSPAQLSQFVLGVSRDGLINCNRIGREKYYYLQKRGEELLKEITKQSKPSVNRRNVPFKTITKDNSRVNDETVMEDMLLLIKLPRVTNDMDSGQFPDSLDSVEEDWFTEGGGNKWTNNTELLSSMMSLQNY